MLSHRPLLSGLAFAGLVLGLAGCAPSTLPPPEGSASAASPTTGGPLSGTPEPDSLDPGQSASAALPAGVTRYECNNGTKIDVRYPDVQTAILNYDGRERTMKIAVSADGARYVGDQYEWWTRGSGRDAAATLYRHTADNATGSIIAECPKRD